MNITVEYLATIDTPQKIRDWFLAKFSNQEIKYQDVLNALAEEDKPDMAFWLLDHVDASGWEWLSIDSNYRHRHVFAAGELSVFDILSVTGWIRAGKSIDAKNSLSADCGIVAGSGLRCDRSVRSKGALVSGGRIDVRQGIDVAGAIQCAYSAIAGENIRSGGDIRTGLKAQAYKDAAKLISDLEGGTNDDIRRAVSELMKASLSEDGCNPLELRAGRDIVAGGSITCPEAICAGANIIVGGSIQSHSLKATESLSISGDLNLEGEAVAEDGIRVGGTACCRGMVSCGDILIGNDLISTAARGYSGSVTTRGILKAGGEILCAATLNAAGMHAGKSIVAGKNINVILNLESGGSVEAEWQIQSTFGAIIAAGSLRAGKSILAGKTISSEDKICCGEGYGIFSRLNEPLQPASSVGEGTDPQATPRPCDGLASISG